MKTDICIIGAGPAGLMAAIAAAQGGVNTVLIERNTSAGRKLRHTGGGRCNLTHTGTVQDFIHAYGRFGRFLRHSLYEFSADDLREYFTGRNMPTKVLPDGCVFPVSEQSGDVAEALLDHVRELSIRILYDKPVQNICKDTNTFTIHTPSETVDSKAVIIATGGVSWPATGSTGDGYEFAKTFGHTIIEPRAALTTLVAAETWIGQLAGVGLDQVTLKTKIDKHQISEHGPLIFTDKGIGGPAVLNLSNHITDFLPDNEHPVSITIDLLPDLDMEQLNTEIIRLCAEHPKKEVAGAFFGLLPKSLIQSLCEQVNPSKILMASSLSKADRTVLVKMVKQLPLSIIAAGPLTEATVTRGGISTTEVNSKTMESKLCPGLYFAGEVLDADGPCGGYNLQIAFSTGRLAGASAAANIQKEDMPEQ